MAIPNLMSSIPKNLAGCLAAASILTQSAKGGEEAVLPLRDPAYQQVWADEFNADGPPDPAKWRSELGFERNEELQYYRPENAECRNGLLVLEARREAFPNPRFSENSKDWRKQRRQAEYTSGSLITVEDQAWSFGRYEIRARFNALPGLWPAIWTTGRGRWPHGGEIDVLEFYQNQILANFLWAGKNGVAHWEAARHPIANFNPDSFNNSFHIWVMEWTEEKIEIFLDGKLLNSLAQKQAVNEDGPPINPFTRPHHFRLNLAIGANAGDPSATPFPQRYEIDYVRIYQKPATAR